MALFSGLVAIYIGAYFGEGAHETYSRRVVLKVELQNWVNGIVISSTDNEFRHSMTVKAARHLVNNMLFDDMNIAFEIVVKAGRVLTYDTIAGGSDSMLHIRVQ